MMKYISTLAAVLTFALVFTACEISTSSEPEIQSEATFEPNIAQQQQARNAVVQTEEPSEPQDEPAPQQTEEPVDIGISPDVVPAIATDPIVIAEAWYIFDRISPDSAEVQSWFFMANNRNEPSDIYQIQLPAAATSVEVDGPFSVTDTDTGPVVVAESPLPANTERQPVIIRYQIPLTNAQSIDFVLDYALEQLVVYTPQSLRPQQEVVGYDYAGVRLIRGMGNFLRFESPPFEANQAIEFALQESAEVRFADDVATVTVEVTVENGTSGGSVPDELEITLLSFEQVDGVPTQLQDASAMHEASGVTVFESVAYKETGVIVVTTEYEDVTFFAQMTGDAITTDTTQMLLRIFETTSDPSVVQTQNLSYIGDAVSEEGAAAYFVDYVLFNNTDRVYVGDAGADAPVMRIPLPAGILAASIAPGSSTQVSVQQEGDQYYVIDNRPVFPEQPQFGSVFFETSHNETSTLEHSWPFAISQMDVFISDFRQLAFEGEGFESLGSTEVSNFGVYDQYRRTNIAANTAYSFTLADTPNTPDPQAPQGNNNTSSATQTTSESDESFLVENRTLILGIGILIVVAGGMFLIYDLQKERIRAMASSGTGPAPSSTKAPSARQRQAMKKQEEDLIRQIAALDDAFERGDVDEETYRAERKRLKEALMDEME